jgi:hypothetical protein
MSSLVAYYRVSTQKQGSSGLGLEAQRAAVAAFAQAEGFTVAAEFTEVETGKGADALDRRPQLVALPVFVDRAEKSQPRLQRHARAPLDRPVPPLRCLKLWMPWLIESMCSWMGGSSAEPMS